MSVGGGGEGGGFCGIGGVGVWWSVVGLILWVGVWVGGGGGGGWGGGGGGGGGGRVGWGRGWRGGGGGGGGAVGVGRGGGGGCARYHEPDPCRELADNNESEGGLVGTFRIMSSLRDPLLYHEADRILYGEGGSDVKQVQRSISPTSQFLRKILG